MNAWIQQGAAGCRSRSRRDSCRAPPRSVLPAADTTPRFHDFKILSQTQVLDPDLKETLGKLLGRQGQLRQRAGALRAERLLSPSSA